MRHVKETLDFVHGARLGNAVIEQNRAHIGFKSRCLKTPELKKQGGAKRIGEKKACGGIGVVRHIVDARDVFRHFPFDRIEPPSHTRHQILGPAFADKSGCKAACLQ